MGKPGSADEVALPRQQGEPLRGQNNTVRIRIPDGRTHGAVSLVKIGTSRTYGYYRPSHLHAYLTIVLLVSVHVLQKSTKEYRTDCSGL